MSSIHTSPAATFEQADALAARLVEEMAAAWRNGDRPLPEDYLRRHPELADHPDAATRLIYEEVCLRQELGDPVPTQEVVRRFPQWQNEIGFVLHCHRLLKPGLAAPSFPVSGETLGDFALLAELGRGALGRVFLATQPALADRPIVLKLTPRDAQEHLSLARLQHTHIVPLYAVQDFPERNLLALCMPYLGGATLTDLLDRLREQPLERRTGRDLVQALDAAQAAQPLAPPARGPARDYLQEASYTNAVCWMGVCLAEALQYAHERGLLHLDLKPSNVLLAADGQPMLLDFHLARAPVPPRSPAPEWLGGTDEYMSPEHRAVFQAVCDGGVIAEGIDGRSDLYSLGLVLYEALGGRVPATADVDLPRLEMVNPDVTVGLADIIHKCLAPDPRSRYRDAGSLAADLRRHLDNLPLRGVANRSLSERWAKWRRREPHQLTQLRTLAVLGVLFVATGAVAYLHASRRMTEARSALAQGQESLAARDYPRAIQTLMRGQALVEGLPGAGSLRNQLHAEMRQASRAGAAQDLRRLVDQLRFRFDAETLPTQSLRALQETVRSASTARARLVQAMMETNDPELSESIRADLLDLAILEADLAVRLASAEGKTQARHEALRALAAAEEQLGPGPVLYQERQLHAEALGLREEAARAAAAAAANPPQTPRQHYALGRFLLRTGRLAEAAAALERAVQLEPQGFWGNFYLGVCAYRLKRFEDAVRAFHVCIALAPGRAECFHNRGLAYQALQQHTRALADYERALQLDPTFAPAALNRGVVFLREKRFAEASSAFEEALARGADPAAVHYHLALVARARGDRLGAERSVRRALEHDAGHQEARELLTALQRQ